MWNVCPDIILNGYVYAGVPPLYKITLSGKYYYLKDDAALEEFRRNHAGKNYQVNRLKGYEIVWPLATLPLYQWGH